MRVSTEGAKKFCFGSFMKQSVWAEIVSFELEWLFVV